jgi:DNA modification methylase
MQIKIIDIKVGPDRFRKTFEDIEGLAESIRDHGLILPIVVDENNVLIDGERRLKACKMNKMEIVEVRMFNELPEIEKKELEIEANLHRQNFTWQEECVAKAKIHALKQKIYGAAVKGHDTNGKWGLKDTAQALGENIATVSIDIQLARGMRAFPELLKEKNKNTAYKKLKQLQENILQEELAKRMKQKGIIDAPNVIHGNCIEEMGKMEACSVDAIITDPPYGIEVEDSQTFGRQKGQDTRFEDSEFETFDLLDKAMPQMFRVLKPDRHMFMFCAIDKFPKVSELLRKHGFWVHHIPLIWDKGSGSYPSQSTTFVHSYEPFIHAMKGKRKLNGTPRDIFQVKRVPSDKKIHPTEKPTELLRELVGLSTLAGETILDPFAGSGATLAAAKETNRQGIGIELDPVYHEKIVNRLAVPKEVLEELDEEEMS